MKQHKARLRFALVAGLAFAAMPTAHAAGVLAGQPVDNTATLDYEVGGSPQTQQNSNTVSFLVDRKISFQTTEVNGMALQVVPNITAQMTVFEVTNTSNATLDFQVVVTQQAGGAAPFNAETDNFDVGGLTWFIDVNDNGVYDVLADTATDIDELGPDDSRRVFVFGDIANTRINGDSAVVRLTATAYQDVDGTGAYTPVAGLAASVAVQSNVGVDDDPAYIDTVFADDETPLDGNTTSDGVSYARDQYNVVTAALAITKSSRVISDGFSATNPKPIPGAIIEYCLDVSNTGAADATSIVLVDSIPANTAYDPASIRSAAVATGATPVAGCDAAGGAGSAAEDDDATDGAEVDGATADYDLTNPGAITINKATIPAATRFKAVFRVEVQ